MSFDSQASKEMQDALDQAFENAKQVLKRNCDKAATKLTELLDLEELDEAQARGANVRYKSAKTILEGHGLLTDNINHSGTLSFVPLNISREDDDVK